MSEDQPRRGGRPCKTCHSEHLIEINEAMRDGVTLAKISEWSGLWPQALSRHRRNHLASFEK